ncbi:MAG: tRNA uridine-5-carboxymethylaminomethyl(34) synthesis GTPase MnmE [Bacteroidales bacterium]|nr:tRNA uridine-5-carboxymethylaminomethyl(34) synthesis GTPase MnmE [Bacteroidales bacterium]
MPDQTTICAISTPAGQGGIAVIRISGPDAFAICDTVYRPMKKSYSVAEQFPNTISFGHIIRQADIIDEVLVSVFRAPHSYTGEDTVEISCHGSIFIQQEILKLLVEQGCKIAAPGEYTQRAYLNGKLDLSQAEAVGDLIAASSAASHKIAVQQMRGGFSHRLSILRDQLLNFTSLVELELDFSEEDVEFADRTELRILASEIETEIRRLTDSFAAGNAIKNGIPVAIIGATNAGKSTLLNQLLKEDKAIVSDIHGTTRDVIEDTIIIDGLMFRFIDTAGIRETNDAIERIGIERTFRKIEQSSIVLWVIDLTEEPDSTGSFAGMIIEKCRDRQLILVLNKSDRLEENELEKKLEYYRHFDKDCMVISAKSDTDIVLLETKLVASAHLPQIGENDIVVTNMRHYEALSRALLAIEKVIRGLDDHIPGDLLAQDIRDCLYDLGTITGQQIHSEEVLQNIFKNFCIGK